MENAQEIREARRLTRPREGRWLAGVSAGLGRYFDLSPAVYRIAFVALALAAGPESSCTSLPGSSSPRKATRTRSPEGAEERTPPARRRDRTGRARVRRRPRARRGDAVAEPREHLVRCGNCRRCARLVGRDQAIKARRLPRPPPKRRQPRPARRPPSRLPRLPPKRRQPRPARPPPSRPHRRADGVSSAV